MFAHNHIISEIRTVISIVITFAQYSCIYIYSVPLSCAFLTLRINCDVCIVYGSKHVESPRADPFTHSFQKGKVLSRRNFWGSFYQQDIRTALLRIICGEAHSSVDTNRYCERQLIMIQVSDLRRPPITQMVHIYGSRQMMTTSRILYKLSQVRLPVSCHQERYYRVSKPPNLFTAEPLRAFPPMHSGSRNSQVSASAMPPRVQQPPSSFLSSKSQQVESPSFCSLIAWGLPWSQSARCIG